MKLSFTPENDNHGGRKPDGNARNADIGGINCVFFDAMALRMPLRLVVVEGTGHGRDWVVRCRGKKVKSFPIQDRGEVP